VREVLRVLQPPGLAADVNSAAGDVVRSDLVLSTDALPLVLASLACGRFDRVQPLIRDAQPGPTLPLVAARYAAWSADLGTLAAAWAAIRASLDLLRDPADAVHAILAATGCAALERVATDLGDAQLAATLLARARAARTRAAELPAHAAARRVAEASGHTRTDAYGDDPAARMLRFVHRTLGVQPDATRLRLRLRPQPVGAAVLEVRDLAFADALVALTVALEGDIVTCRLEQESGAIPATAILELVAPGEAVEAEVDGRRAELTPRRDEDGLVVPVQLVLDAPRTVVLRPR
jgi:hypothetical protein